MHGKVLKLQFSPQFLRFCISRKLTYTTNDKSDIFNFNSPQVIAYRNYFGSKLQSLELYEYCTPCLCKFNPKSFIYLTEFHQAYLQSPSSSGAVVFYYDFYLTVMGHCVSMATLLCWRDSSV